MPEPISFLDKDILVNGVSTQKVAGTLKLSGLDDVQVGSIVGWWLVGATGDTRPLPFRFSTDVQTSDPDAVVTYEREFAHSDWVDGEDRVQAGTTPEEVGFNARFHAIENEFDRVADQFARLAAAVAEVRSDLVGVVRELTSKLTALQNELHDLRAESAPKQPSPGNLGVLGSITLENNKSAFVTKVGNDFKLIEFAGATIGQSDPILPPGRFGGVVFRPDLIRPEEVVDVVTGIDDLLNVPLVREVVERPGATVADLRAAVGGAELRNGMTAASVLAALPSDQALTGVTEAVQLITADVISRLPAESASAVLQAVVTDADAQDLDATVLGEQPATVVGLGTDLAGALVGAGVGTSVHDFSAVDVTRTVKDLASAGVSVNVGVLKNTVARSRIVTAFGRL